MSDQTQERLQFLPFEKKIESITGDKFVYSHDNPNIHNNPNNPNREFFTARIPTQATRYSVCYDLYAAYSSHESAIVDIPAHNRKLFATGIKLMFPKGSNKFAKIETRSSMAKIGIQVLGGVIDPDYQGEIKVILQNHNTYPVSVILHDAIAQIGIYEYFKVDNTLIPLDMLHHEQSTDIIEKTDDRAEERDKLIEVRDKHAEGKDKRTEERDQFIEVQNTRDKHRGEGGFGSTNKN